MADIFIYGVYHGFIKVARLIFIKDYNVRFVRDWHLLNYPRQRRKWTDYFELFFSGGAGRHRDEAQSRSDGR
jgi:hypothetical protein